MSGNGPRTLAGLGDLPGNAGNTNVTGNPSATAEWIFERCGAKHFWQGDVMHDVCGPENRRNRITSINIFSGKFFLNKVDGESSGYSTLATADWIDSSVKVSIFSSPYFIR